MMLTLEMKLALSVSLFAVACSWVAAFLIFRYRLERATKDAAMLATIWPIVLFMVACMWEVAREADRQQKKLSDFD